MTLSCGTRLGNYEIRSKLGAGGMGEVYLARDMKLGREVAIKLLGGGFGKDAERLARFEREARLLAALSHPQIASLFGLEESDGTQFLVMELVTGVTLEEKLNAGPVPIDEALIISRQIAEALEAAHERGIIHRDLKPSNIKITEDERVKVLDFGLAKALTDRPDSDNVSESPTVLYVGTETGIILGTAAYMSPEQAKGKNLDKRTDIWSFGCVLYEMLTGKRPFFGETTTDILASIIRADPDWTVLPSATPKRIRELLRRCLEKDPKMRLRDIGDARIELTTALGAPADEPAISPAITVPSRMGWRRNVLFALGGLLIGALVVGLVFWRVSGFGRSGASTTQPVNRFAITLSESEQMALTKFVPLAVGRVALALSPDGANLVYVSSRNGTAQLLLRPLDQFEARPIAGTDGSYNPFFSPDGKWVGFFADNKLKKVALSGGEPLTLCEARNPIVASWGPNGEIFFGDQEGSTLKRVSTEGGTPQGVSTEGLQINHVDVLPDGKWLLISTWQGSNPDNFEIQALSLESGKIDVVLQGASNPHYLSTGHLLFTRAGAMMAAPFDLENRKVTGPPVAVVEGIRSEIYGNAQFGVSDNGTMVYVPGSAGWIGKPVWVDRKGNITPIALPPQCYGAFKLSADGKRLAIQVVAMRDDIWVYEFDKGTFLRLTTEGNNINPSWSPDGKTVAFCSIRNRMFTIFVKSADGSGAEQQVWGHDSPESGTVPESWSPDGKVLSVVEWNSNDAGNIGILPLEGEGKPRPFLHTQFSEFFSSFSPDGHWIAYTSDESGRYEIYVRPYPGPGGKWQISTEGGEEPVWSADGKELFYRNGEKWMVAAVQTNPGFRSETPRMMFERYFLNVPGLSHQVAPDGQRRVMIQPAAQDGPPKQINVVLNWFEELKRRVPADQ